MAAPTTRLLLLAAGGFAARAGGAEEGCRVRGWGVHGDLLLPRGTHVVFMGDSIARFQYLDLVFRLEYGAEAEAFLSAAVHNPLVSQSYENWTAFYEHTHAMLRGRETCDCYRHPSRWSKHMMMENRHYESAGPCALRASYFQVLGELPSKGILSGAELRSGRGPMRQEAFVAAVRAGKLWSVRWERAIERHVRPLRPTVVMLNAGFFKSESVVWAEVRDAARAASGCAVWRTTTPVFSARKLISPPQDTAARRAFAASPLLEGGRLVHAHLAARLGVGEAAGAAYNFHDRLHFNVTAGGPNPYHLLNDALLRGLLHRPRAPVGSADEASRWAARLGVGNATAAAVLRGLRRGPCRARDAVLAGEHGGAAVRWDPPLPARHRRGRDGRHQVDVRR